MIIAYVTAFWTSTFSKLRNNIQQFKNYLNFFLIMCLLQRPKANFLRKINKQTQIHTRINTVQYTLIV